MINHIVMIAMQLDRVLWFALYWFGVPVFSASIDRSSAWDLSGQYRGQWICNRTVVLISTAPLFSSSVPSPSNRVSDRFMIMCPVHICSYPHHFFLCPAKTSSCFAMSPSRLKNSHDFAQGRGCSVVLRESRHPSDGKYWVYFLLPCFLRWRVILLSCLGCVGSYRRKVWMVHCFLGR